MTATTMSTYNVLEDVLYFGNDNFGNDSDEDAEQIRDAVDLIPYHDCLSFGLEVVSEQERPGATDEHKERSSPIETQTKPNTVHWQQHPQTPTLPSDLHLHDEDDEEWDDYLEKVREERTLAAAAKGDSLTVFESVESKAHVQATPPVSKQTTPIDTHFDHNAQRLVFQGDLPYAKCPFLTESMSNDLSLPVPRSTTPLNAHAPRIREEVTFQSEPPIRDHEDYLGPRTTLTEENLKHINRRLKGGVASLGGSTCSCGSRSPTDQDSTSGRASTPGTTPPCSVCGNGNDGKEQQGLVQEHASATSIRTQAELTLAIPDSALRNKKIDHQALARLTPAELKMVTQYFRNGKYAIDLLMQLRNTGLSCDPDHNRSNAIAGNGFIWLRVTFDEHVGGSTANPTSKNYTSSHHGGMVEKLRPVYIPNPYDPAPEGHYIFTFGGKGLERIPEDKHHLYVELVHESSAYEHPRGSVVVVGGANLLKSDCSAYMLVSPVPIEFTSPMSAFGSADSSMIMTAEGQTVLDAKLMALRLERRRANAMMSSSLSKEEMTPIWQAAIASYYACRNKQFARLERDLDSIASEQAPARVSKRRRFLIKVPGRMPHFGKGKNISGKAKNNSGKAKNNNGKGKKKKNDSKQKKSK